jgi:hypothetical protein
MNHLEPGAAVLWFSMGLSVNSIQSQTSLFLKAEA